jgi:hypothetical protein
LFDHEARKQWQGMRNCAGDALVHRFAGEGAQVGEPVIRRVGDTRCPLQGRPRRREQAAADPQVVGLREMRVDDRHRHPLLGCHQCGEHAGGAGAKHDKVESVIWHF